MARIPSVQKKTVLIYCIMNPPLKESGKKTRVDANNLKFGSFLCIFPKSFKAHRSWHLALHIVHFSMGELQNGNWPITGAVCMAFSDEV